MSTGVVTSTSPDTGSATLTAAVTATDTVLPVDDAAAFAEDFSESRWLVIGSEMTPREYIGVQNDEELGQETVTLAAAVGGTGFEADLPVTPWDPSSPAADKRAVEHKVSVRLDGQDGTILALVPHAMIPVAGIDYLIGAGVRLVETYPSSGEWKVAEVFGRDAVVDGMTVTNRNVTLLQPAAVVSVSDSFDRILDNLQVVRSSDIVVRVETTAGPRLGTVYIDTPGIYLVTLTLSWAGSNVGHRRARIVQGGNSVFFPAIEVGEVRTTPVTGSNTIMQVTGVLYDTEVSGGEFSVFVYQNSGASLNVSAASAVQIVKLG